jgi:hypothetical protein
MLVEVAVGRHGSAEPGLPGPTRIDVLWAAYATNAASYSSHYARTM